MIPGSVTQAQAAPVVLGGIPAPWAEFGFTAPKDPDSKGVWLNFLTPLLFSMSQPSLLLAKNSPHSGDRALQGEYELPVPSLPQEGSEVLTRGL